MAAITPTTNKVTIAGSNQRPLATQATLHTIAASPPTRMSIEDEIAAPLFSSFPTRA